MPNLKFEPSEVRFLMLMLQTGACSCPRQVQNILFILLCNCVSISKCCVRINKCCSVKMACTSHRVARMSFTINKVLGNVLDKALVHSRV